MTQKEYLINTRDRLQVVLNEDIEKANAIRNRYATLQGKTDERSRELLRTCISDMRCLRRHHERRLALLEKTLRLLEAL